MFGIHGQWGALLVEVGLRAQNAICNFRMPCDHKHIQNKLFFLMPSFHSPVVASIFTKKKILLPFFHSPWIIVIIINYINNKRNSISIHFIFCYRKYSRWSGWARFFLTTIITIMEGLGLFFSCYHKYTMWWDLFAFSFRV